MINLLVFISYFYFLLFSIIGYGIFFQNLCFKKIDKFNLQTPIYIGFFGLFLITLISVITSIFVSHNFVHNLLWYPAFENLFSIFRRTFYKRKNYEADNEHLHQLLFQYFEKKKLFKQKYLLSSATGIIINIYLSTLYFIGFINYSETKLQIILILFTTVSYLSVYFMLKNDR